MVHSTGLQISLLFICCTWGMQAVGQSTDTAVSAERLLSLAFEYDPDRNQEIFTELDQEWKNEYAFPLVDLLRLSNDDRLYQSIITLLTKKANRPIAQYDDALIWSWSLSPEYLDDYSDFKGELYRHIDPPFRLYFFGRQSGAQIRLDEIVWGGVQQDGIPPLRNPQMIKADEAAYLDDSDVVFAIEINGDARAYPKRILAWHEFFDDVIGGVRIAGVYCTLCGTVIGYDVTHGGVTYDLGTSGFLYRSNKLMYDKATQSLWNTIDGAPVLGPLVGKGIKLGVYPVVTTTWGKWKALHPGSKVLSIETGHQRDYAEGAAYRNYFGTDELMFPVPQTDKRLLNKAEVLITRVAGYEQDPLAISIDWLRRRKLHLDAIAGTKLVALADASGAARVYAAGEYAFFSYRKGELKDNQGGIWQVSEQQLSGPDGQLLERLPVHNSFWFAWYNMYPKTRLVK